MKVLVTGSNGLIGSRLVELEDKLELITPQHQDFDVNNPQQIAEVLSKEQPEWVIHLAGYTDVEKAQKEEKKLADTINYTGTKNLVGACKRFSARLLYLSTDHIFPGGGIYTEDSRVKPVNEYGWTKYRGEQAVQAGGRDYIIVRSSYPFRAKFDKKSDIVRTLINRLKDGKELDLVSDQKVTPTFIDELVLGITKLVKENKRGIYNLSGRECLSFVDIGKNICEVFGFDKKLIKEIYLEEFMKKYDKKAPQPKISCMNCDKFYKETLMVTSDFKSALVKMKAQIEPVQSVRMVK
jgi:dTDP-4-dehydrorhamnose reductase